MFDNKIPPPIGILFGPQIGWSPARERELLVGESCDVCRATRQADGSMKGGAIKDGSRILCAGCQKYGLDSLVYASRARSRLVQVSANTLSHSEENENA